MTKLGHLLQEFLDLAQWSGDIATHEDTGSSHLDTGATIDDQPCRIHVIASDTVDSIVVLVCPPFRVRTAKYAEACKLVNAINYRTALGRLEIDPQDGEIRYQHSSDVEFCQPTPEFIRSMIRFASGHLTHWMPALAEVAMTARTAEEILAGVDGKGMAAGETRPADAPVAWAVRSAAVH
jgi:hypothetical protein